MVMMTISIIILIFDEGAKLAMAVFIGVLIDNHKGHNKLDKLT